MSRCNLSVSACMQNINFLSGAVVAISWREINRQVQDCDLIDKQEETVSQMTFPKPVLFLVYPIT